MKIEFLLLPEYGEQSERKNEQIPLFFHWQPELRPSLSGCAAAERRGLLRP